MAIINYQNHKPQISKKVYIADSAEVIGNVTILQDSSVWPLSVIRGDVGQITIGERTSIQDGTILHVTHNGPYNPCGFNLEIGNDVTIGHRVMLHGCKIRSACLIGIGSIILDNSVIESHTLVAAGSLVPEGKLLDGGLWLGTPVKKIRELTEREIDFFYYSASKYVELKNNYLNPSDGV